MERFTVGGCDVIVDGAHNGHAARRIVPFIEKELQRPRTLVFGMLSDKDVREVAAVLFPHFDRIVLTRPDSERAMEPQALLELARSFAEAEVVRSADEAVAEAARQGAGSVLVAGSLYLAGSAVAVLDRLKADVRAKS
jgi:dihydrofolate synthase/folylpolyglutamate synthase